jgi:small subunit ribosomal protein S6
MENYELVVVLDGKVTSAKVKTVREKLEKIIATFNGKIGKIEDWGKKDLAYKVKKSDTGYYLMFPLELEKASVSALGLKLKMEADIIRHLILKAE